MIRINFINYHLHLQDKWRNLSYHVPSSAWPAPESSSDNNYKESEPWYVYFLIMKIMTYCHRFFGGFLVS